MYAALHAAETTLRERRTQRALARRVREQLVADLATYRSPSDLADLHAMIARSDERDTVEVRAILAHLHAA